MASISERNEVVATELKNNFLECAVCLSPFQFPKTLSCRHSFCSACIKGVFKQNCRNIIQCPLCRKLTYVRDGVHGVDKLPEDLAIRNAINILKQYRKKRQQDAPLKNETDRQPLKNETNQTSCKPAWK